MQPDLQSDSIGVLKIEGLAVAALHNLSDLNSGVLKHLISLIEFCRSRHQQSNVIQPLSAGLLGHFRSIRYGKCVTTTDVRIVVPAPVSGAHGTRETHAQNPAVELEGRLHIVGIGYYVVNIRALEYESSSFKLLPIK